MKKYCLVILILLFSKIVESHDEITELELKSINQVLDLILPDEKIWRINGNSVQTTEVSKLSTYVVVDFTPFKSSVNYCRYTSLHFEKPGLHGSKSEKSYSIQTKDYIALRLNDVDKCNQIEIKNYFEITENLSDSIINYSLEELKKINLSKMAEDITHSCVECFTSENIENYLKSVTYNQNDRSIEYILRQCDPKKGNTHIIINLDYSKYKGAVYDVIIKEVTNDGIRDFR
jgi:hypothetical protein